MPVSGLSRECGPRVKYTVPVRYFWAYSMGAGVHRSIRGTGDMASRARSAATQAEIQLPALGSREKKYSE